MIHEKFKKKGLCVGPMGFPQKEESARILEEKIKRAEKDGLSYKRNFVTRAPLELEEGERADISIINTIDVDRDREVVVANGADLSQFQKNPVVTFGHKYDIPPVGRAMWVKFEPTRATAKHIKAKTEYAPEGLYELADTTWGLVKAGFLVGKSVGFMPEEVGPPTQKEVDQSEGKWANADRIIRKWSLFEYAVATVPANGHALVEAVAKGELNLPEVMVKSMGLLLPSSDDTIITDLWAWDDPEPQTPKYSKSLKAIEQSIIKQFGF